MYEEVLQAVKDRDCQDMNREVDPLRQAEDAILVDTTNMIFDEVAENVMENIEKKRIIRNIGFGKREKRTII